MRRARQESMGDKIHRFRSVILVVSIPIFLVLLVIYLMPRGPAPLPARDAALIGRKAGSSGSRVHVYCFDGNLDLLPIGQEIELFVQILSCVYDKEVLSEKAILSEGADDSDKIFPKQSEQFIKTHASWGLLDRNSIMPNYKFIDCYIGGQTRHLIVHPDMGDGCYSFELIDGNGVYNVSGMENFIKTVKLGECGLSYVVVSIMGPQSSGKSTLLNHLFHTNFKEMDAFKGRSQTTKGIWLARCMDIEPCTIIMDLEGSDGRERGEDDIAFEKQSAIFALTVSDIVLINMWCHDIGREQADNKPLLRIAMMQLFSPRKTTLLIVIRDKTKTSLEKLEPILREDLQKIWDSIKKPLEHKNAPLSEFFNVEVVALSSFEEKEEQFKEQREFWVAFGWRNL